MSSVREAYQAELKAGGYQSDPAQLRAIDALQRCAEHGRVLLAQGHAHMADVCVLEGWPRVHGRTEQYGATLSFFGKRFECNIFNGNYTALLRLVSCAHCKVTITLLTSLCCHHCKREMQGRNDEKGMERYQMHEFCILNTNAFDIVHGTNWRSAFQTNRPDWWVP